MRRIKRVRSWTDKQIEIRCERVGPEKFGVFDSESQELFSDVEGKLQVLVQYILTEEQQNPNIKIYISGSAFKFNQERHPVNLDEVTGCLVANGANVVSTSSQYDYLDIFTPESIICRYDNWTLTVLGSKIDYSGNAETLERALKSRIMFFRNQVTKMMKVRTFICSRRT